MPDVPPSQQRNSLKPATAEHEQAADLLSAAADAFLSGRREAASAYLRAADFPELFRFGRLLMDRKDLEVAWPVRQPSGTTPAIARVKGRMPSKVTERAIYERDGWRCRYCGCQVVYKYARDILRKEFPIDVIWPASGRSHGGFLALTATPDHIIPHARGGDSSPDNIVTACWPCNFAMEDNTLDELGLSDPRQRPPVVDKWDGLTRLIACTAPRQAVPGARAATASHRGEPGTTPGKHILAADWFGRLNPQKRPLAKSLVAILERCSDLDVTWSAKQVLIARMTVGSQRVTFFGVLPDMTVQIPWTSNTKKDQLRQFSMVLAGGIPGAAFHETSKLWNVTLPPRRTMPVDLLLENEVAIRAALEALHTVLNDRN